MVTVVRSGPIKTDSIYQGECNICGSLLEFNYSEVQVRTGFGGTYWKITCPECKETACIENTDATRVKQGT